MEDALEELLQEEIFDENNDQMEKEAERIALWVGRHWKRKKTLQSRSVASIVGKDGKPANESTSLLETGETSQLDGSRENGLLDNIFERFNV